VVLAESMYLTMPGAVRGDMVGLLEFVTREDYYDNFLTRMLANVPAHVEVTEEHFKEARMILENKFLIGMTNDVAETVQKRLKLYFGWEELPSQQGCEMYYIKNGVMALPPVTIEEGGHYWRAIQKINLFDMKLYARAMSVFGQQKMRMPVHPLAVQKEREVVNEAFARLRNVDEPLDESDVPFFCIQSRIIVIIIHGRVSIRENIFFGMTKCNPKNQILLTKLQTLTHTLSLSFYMKGTSQKHPEPQSKKYSPDATDSYEPKWSNRRNLSTCTANTF